MKWQEWAIVAGLLLVGLIVGIFVGQPYPVHLEELERNSLVSQHESEVDKLEDQIGNCWQAQKDAVVVAQDKCLARIKDMAKANRVLKDGCVQAIGKVEDAIADLNESISDCNC